MPYINISTSLKIVDKKKFLEEISTLISYLTSKSRKFVMAKLSDNCDMFFDDEGPCCFLEIKSIGSLSPSDMAKQICNFVSDKLGIPIDKIYISFEDVSASMWAWNGKTFG
tara:strand:+ start:308 stop:640 length:333 start_codon:yes stop_codon:yes gene_type:complete